MSATNVPPGYGSARETCGACGVTYHPAEDECACGYYDSPEEARAAVERAAEEEAERRAEEAEWERRNR